MKLKLPLVLLIVVLVFLSGCGRDADPLIVYAGKGLKYPVDEIVRQFEQWEGVPVKVIYAGSKTLLTSIETTRKGDVFIPGSPFYIKKAGELVTRSEYVAMHVPVIALNANKADVVQTYADLAKSGVRIAIGNKYMAAIGRVTESILEASPPQHNFRANIVVTASTVNELLQLVVEGRVDAALVWQDMLQWQSAKGLKSIEIPAALNQIKEIRVASLSLTANRGTATKFTDFVASEGRGIFEQHGFGKK